MTFYDRDSILYQGREKYRPKKSVPLADVPDERRHLGIRGRTLKTLCGLSCKDRSWTNKLIEVDCDACRALL